MEPDVTGKRKKVILSIAINDELDRELRKIQSNWREKRSVVVRQLLLKAIREELTGKAVW